MTLIACASERDANITNGWMSPGETRIRLDVDTCNAQHRTRVDETANAVRVAIKARNDENGDCADSVELTLAAPLGDRTLIDDADDEPVPVVVDQNLRDAP